MIWLIEILRICLEKQLLIKYYVMKDLILLEVQVIMNIKAHLLQLFINFSIKSLQVVVLKVKLYQTKNIFKYNRKS